MDFQILKEQIEAAAKKAFWKYMRNMVKKTSIVLHCTVMRSNDRLSVC